MTTVVNLKDRFSKDLGMRSVARKIFEGLNDDEMVFDFEGIEFISRSFAQEYMQQKYTSNIKVSESNMCDFVAGLMNVVEKDYIDSCL